MALKSTIYKAALSIADIDNAYYADHALTLARHPSETDERMMMRLVALAFEAYQLQATCNNDAHLLFGAGLSNPDEPDVWLKDFTGATRLWVEVGQPDDKPLTKASSRSDQVAVYAYHHAAHVWWKGIQDKVARLSKLRVYYVANEQSLALAAMAQRNMALQATLQEGSLLLSDGKTSVSVEPVRWQ